MAAIQSTNVVFSISGLTVLYEHPAQRRSRITPLTVGEILDKEIVDRT